MFWPPVQWWYGYDSHVQQLTHHKHSMIFLQFRTRASLEPSFFLISILGFIYSDRENWLYSMSKSLKSFKFCSAIVWPNLGDLCFLLGRTLVTRLIPSRFSGFLITTVEPNNHVFFSDLYGDGILQARRSQHLYTVHCLHCRLDDHFLLQTGVFPLPCSFLGV